MDERVDQFNTQSRQLKWNGANAVAEVCKSDVSFGQNWTPVTSTPKLKFTTDQSVLLTGFTCSKMKLNTSPQDDDGMSINLPSDDSEDDEDDVMTVILPMGAGDEDNTVDDVGGNKDTPHEDFSVEVEIIESSDKEFSKKNSKIQSKFYNL